MIYICFAAVALGASLSAATVSSMKRAALSLWIAGLSMGGIYLTLGAEALAIIQWIVSTLVAMSFFFFAVMFGEYESREAKPGSGSDRKKALTLSVAALLGLVFTGVIYLGSGNVTPEMLEIPKSGNDLFSLGRVMTGNHLISLEVLALTLFLVLVGGGVVARPESGSDGGNDGC